MIATHQKEKIMFYSWVVAVSILVLTCVPECTFAAPGDVPGTSVSDLAKLLAMWAEICESRWDIHVEADRVCLYSKGTVLGSAPGYNFGPGEENYRLQFRFKVVNTLDGRMASQRRRELELLRKLGNTIEHHEAMGYYRYSPKGEKEWDIVLQIKRAEARVAEIPDIKFRSAYLATEYSMDFFQPNKTNERAIQYKKDIEKIYALLERIARTAPEGN
jgi:hypothetical protein